MRYELSDHEWAAIKPMLPNKPRGVPSAGSITWIDQGRSSAANDLGTIDAENVRH